MPAFETVIESGGRKSSETPSSPTSKVKGWIKNRFSRGKSASDGSDKGKSFVGGAALRDPEANDSNASLEQRPTSMRDVALAGKTGPGRDTNEATAARDSHGVSPVDSSDSDEYEENQEPTGLTMAPPRPLQDPAVRTSISPSRDSKFREIING